MYDIVEGLHKALRIEATWAFVLVVAFGSAIVGGIFAWIIDTGYKNSAEYKAERLPKQQTVTPPNVASQDATVQHPATQGMRSARSPHRPSTPMKPQSPSPSPSPLRLPVEVQTKMLQSWIQQTTDRTKVSEMWLSQIFQSLLDGIPDGPDVDVPHALRHLAAEGKVTILETTPRNYRTWWGEIFQEDIRFRVQNPTQPSISQECPGGNCAVSIGQRGGITAGQIINEEPITWYEWNGAKHSRRGNDFSAIAGSEMSDFNKMLKLEVDGDWKTLKDLSRKELKDSPDWPTPLFVLSIAESHLCEKEDAMSNTRTFISRATKAAQFSETYDGAIQIAKNNLTAMAAGNWPNNCR